MRRGRIYSSFTLLNPDKKPSTKLYAKDFKQGEK
jgi:hypothetical protein